MNPKIQFDQDTLSRIKRATAAGVNPAQIQQEATEYQMRKNAKGQMDVDSFMQKNTREGQSRTKQSPDKGFQLTDLLPLVGGIGGGLLGGAVGSVLPGPGTAVGGITGGAAGSAGGEWLRQKLTPEQDDDLGKVATEGLWGLAGGVGGLAVGKGVGLAAKGVRAGLKKTGTGLIASQFKNVGRPFQKEVGGAFRIVDDLAEYGLFGPDDYVRANQTVNPVIEKIKLEAIRSANKVNLGKFRIGTTNNFRPSILTEAQRLADDPSMTDSTAKKFTAFISNAVREASKGNGTKGLTEVKPENTFAIIQKLQSKARDLKKGKTLRDLTSDESALRNAYLELARDLEDRLYKIAGADSKVLGMIQPEDIAFFQGQNKNLLNDVLKSNDVKSLRALQAKFIRGSELAEEQAFQSSPLNNMGINQVNKGISNVLPSVGDPLAPGRAVLATDTANRWAGRAVRGAANLPLPSNPMIPITGGQLAVSGLRGGAEDLDQQAYQSSQSDNRNIGSDYPQNNFNNHGSMVSDNPAFVNTGIPMPMGEQPLLTREQAFMLMAANPKQASAIKALYEMGQPESSKVSVTGAKNQALAKSGLRNLQIIRQELQDDPAVVFKQAVPGKFFSRQFDSALFRTVEALLRLRTGAAAPEQEVRRYMSQWGPRIGDSPEVVATKLEALEQDLVDAYESGFQKGEDQSTIPLPSDGLGLGF